MYVNRSFQILTLNLSHPPQKPTRYWEFEYERGPIAIEKGGEYKITLFSPAIMQVQWLPGSDCRLSLLNLQVCNYRCECSRCRIRVRATHRSWFTWSSSWRNVAGSSRRMIRENTEFPLDAILTEESDRSLVLRGFGRFSAFCAGEREVCESLTVFPYPVSRSLPRRRF